MRLRRSHAIRWLAAAALLLVAPALTAQVHAQARVIKLATLVPEGTVWHKVLADLGDDWSRATAGRVSMRIYPGGVAGDESDMVRKMRIGQIQAGALTVVGLSEIDPAFMVFATPMLFESYDELLYVIDRMQPTLEKRLEAKGFVLLNWGHAGWLYFFTKDPVTSVADLKKTKMFVPAGDDDMVQAWKNMGFQPVPLAMTDILTGLQTGMIDALPNTPLGVLMLQWFRSTPNMLDAGLAPLVGGLVIQKGAWSKLSEADRNAVGAACAKAETRLEREIPGQDAAALAEMKKRGLKVNAPTSAAKGEFRGMAEQFAGRMRGGIVPAEIMDMALRERNAYRARDTAKSAP